MHHLFALVRLPDDRPAIVTRDLSGRIWLQGVMGQFAIWKPEENRVLVARDCDSPAQHVPWLDLHPEYRHQVLALVCPD